MNPYLEILIGLAVGTLIGGLLGWLVGSRQKPDFNTRLEDELREQIRQLQESLTGLRKELSESNALRTAAEAAKISSDLALSERRGLQQQAEQNALELRDKLGRAESSLATAEHKFKVQEELSRTLTKDRDSSKDVAVALQNDLTELKQKRSALDEQIKYLNERLTRDAGNATQKLEAQEAICKVVASERDESRTAASKLQNELNETRQKNSALNEQIKFLNERLASDAANSRQKVDGLDAAGKSLALERDESKKLAVKTQLELNEIKQKNSALDEQLKYLSERLSEERGRLQTLQETFKKEFEAISNKLLLDSSSQFTKQSSASLEDLLKPLKTNIDEFKAKLDAAHTDAATQNALLKDQIKNIGAEAANLSKALKGDAKALGNWGENMLDLILEKSGLQKGVHYHRQAGVSDGGDQRFLDVLVDLPDGKHLVIDSKVSLKHYESHVNCTDEELRQSTLTSHIVCIQSHIRGLSSKRYQDIYGINAPDFVLMYIPIEAAFFVAISNDQSLFADAHDKNVVLITNSSLLATLRTVASVWRLADQKKNHKDIADRGGLLYDKFVSFIADMQKIGGALNDGKSAWEEAFKKLHKGSGNLVSQAESLRKLGVKAKKALPMDLVEFSDETDLQSAAAEGKASADPQLSAPAS